jgi:hypothetical protein
MRIIGSIPHPTLKISVFKSDNRISVKFENARYEQTFKLGDEEHFKSLENLEKWADATLLEQVQTHFRLMHQAALEAGARAFPPSQTNEFEEII